MAQMNEISNVFAHFMRSQGPFTSAFQPVSAASMAASSGRI
ncbi:hypothetical protein [Microvirga pakistanensis]|nr:hypothetical protein [Microvirga pakistanensis]